MELKENNKRRLYGYFSLVVCLLYLVFVSATKRIEEKFLLSYLVPVIFIFFGMAFFQEQWKGPLWLGVALVGWYVISRVALGDYFLTASRSQVFILSILYLMAFPFAAIMNEKGMKVGLTIAAAIGAAGFSACAWLGAIIPIIGKNIVIPGLGSPVSVNEYGRLMAFGHPNHAACFFLLGMLCVGYLGFSIRKRTMIFPVLFMGIGLWLGLAFTVSRTAMLQCAAAAAAIVFMAIWRSPVRELLSRFLLALLAALLVFLLVYKSFGWITEAVANSRANAEVVQEIIDEEIEEPVQPIAVRPLENDLKSLTGRTIVWRGAFELVKEQPRILLVGMPEHTIGDELNRCVEQNPYDFKHAHNTYIQMLLTMGIPGLCLALVFTWLTLRSAWNILFVKLASRKMTECWMALACPVLLISAITEPYLFVERGSIPACNFYFLLFLGYNLQTERQIRAGMAVQEHDTMLVEK